MYLNTRKLQISKRSWLKITKDKPCVVQTKTTFSELEAWSAYNGCMSYYNNYYIVIKGSYIFIYIYFYNFPLVSKKL